MLIGLTPLYLKRHRDAITLSDEYKIDASVLCVNRIGLIDHLCIKCITKYVRNKFLAFGCTDVFASPPVLAKKGTKLFYRYVVIRD